MSQYGNLCLDKLNNPFLTTDTKKSLHASAFVHLCLLFWRSKGKKWTE